jgi:hypothetical protein
MRLNSHDHHCRSALRARRARDCRRMGRVERCHRALLVAGGSTTELSATDARLLGSWPVIPVDKHESRNSEPPRVHHPFDIDRNRPRERRVYPSNALHCVRGRSGLSSRGSKGLAASFLQPFCLASVSASAATMRQSAATLQETQAMNLFEIEIGRRYKYDHRERSVLCDREGKVGRHHWRCAWGESWGGY